MTEEELGRLGDGAVAFLRQHYEYVNDGNEAAIAAGCFNRGKGTEKPIPAYVRGMLLLRPIKVQALRVTMVRGEKMRRHGVLSLINVDIVLQTRFGPRTSSDHAIWWSKEHGFELAELPHDWYLGLLGRPSSDN